MNSLLKHNFSSTRYFLVYVLIPRHFYTCGSFAKAFDGRSQLNFYKVAPNHPMRLGE